MERNGTTEEQEVGFWRLCAAVVLIFGLALLTAISLNLWISPLIRADTDPVLLVCALPATAVFAAGVLATCILVALKYGPIRGRKKEIQRRTK
jgi:hypothetical protein